MHILRQMFAFYVALLNRLECLVHLYYLTFKIHPPPMRTATLHMALPFLVHLATLHMALSYLVHLACRFTWISSDISYELNILIKNSNRYCRPFVICILSVIHLSNLGPYMLRMKSEFVIIWSVICHYFAFDLLFDNKLIKDCIGLFC